MYAPESQELYDELRRLVEGNQWPWSLVAKVINRQYPKTLTAAQVKTLYQIARERHAQTVISNHHEAQSEKAAVERRYRMK